MVRFGVTPEINALATIIMLTSFVMIFIAQRKSKVLESL
jgi:spermidine/putrescine transport system permease protein